VYELKKFQPKILSNFITNDIEITSKESPETSQTYKIITVFKILVKGDFAELVKIFLGNLDLVINKIFEVLFLMK
jgi:hypothetical protein